MNKNIRLLIGAGSVAALAILGLQGCGSDSDGGTAKAGASGAGGPGAGAPGAGSGGASAGAPGAGSGGASAGAPAAGSGTGGASAGAGGATGGAGGASGGAGGASGGASGGSGGAAPSADCTKWCSGANGVIAQCAGKLPTTLDTEAKCIANCTKPNATGDMGLSCWNKHLAFIVGGQDKTTHCPHTTGAANNGQCNVTQ